MPRHTHAQATRHRDCDLIAIGAKAASSLYERYLHEAHHYETYEMWLSRIAI
jgi:coproporphyrinogen III oxidase-like Fe-S oxidoreductase